MKNVGFKLFVSIVALVLVLAVSGIYLFNHKRVTPSTNEQKGIQLTQTQDGNYQTVVKDGHYLTSVARGITSSSQQNTLDTKSFDSGLLDLSKTTFKPSSYIFQEGQYLSAETIMNWLARQNDNEQGLNPADNGKSDDQRAPMYVQSISEQDFMTKSGSDLKLAGMTIGIAMNTVDMYEKEQYGPSFSQAIDHEQMATYGKEVAKKVLDRLRSNKEIGNDVPIMIAMYANAPADSLTSGTFYGYNVIDKGNSLSEWHDLDWYNIVLPKEASDTSDTGSKENSAFANFKNDIQTFFPNIAGATASAQFRDNNLYRMDVTVNTQFYSQTEIQAFASAVANSAQKFLPGNAPMQIVIKTATGMQALLTRKENESAFEINLIQ